LQEEVGVGAARLLRPNNAAIPQVLEANLASVLVMAFALNLEIDIFVAVHGHEFRAICKFGID